MSFAALVKKAWERDLLFSVLMELTYDCNWNCSFCYNDINAPGQKLSTAQWKALLDELAHMQVFQLILTGGEPLSHPDFFEIATHARNRGFMTRIKSNGHALRGKNLDRMVQDVQPFVIDVSLHGATPNTHDRQTGIVGSFHRLLDNIAAAKDAGLHIKVNSVLTRWNEHEVAEMYAITEKLDVPHAFNDDLSPRDDGDQSPLTLAPSTEGLQAFMRAQRAHHRKLPDLPTQKRSVSPDEGKRNCGAGTSTLTVNPMGHVFPCVQWRVPVGNLHHQSIQAIWQGSPALQTVRQQNEQAKRLVDANGGARSGIKFCPGLSHAQTGSPLQIYPSARRRMGLMTAESGKERRTRLPVLP